MIKNVGWIDRVLRFLLGLFLVWTGLFLLKGIDGNGLGIVIALISLMPFYMAITRSCFVFRWIKVHSLSRRECEIYGQPYQEGNKL